VIASIGLPAVEFLARDLHKAQPEVIRKMRAALLGGSGGLSAVNDVDLSEAFRGLKPGTYRCTAQQRLLVAWPGEAGFRPLVLPPVTFEVDL